MHSQTRSRMVGSGSTNGLGKSRPAPVAVTISAQELSTIHNLLTNPVSSVRKEISNSSAFGGKDETSMSRTEKSKTRSELSAARSEKWSNTLVGQRLKKEEDRKARLAAAEAALAAEDQQFKESQEAELLATVNRAKAMVLTQRDKKLLQYRNQLRIIDTLDAQLDLKKEILAEQKSLDAEIHEGILASVKQMEEEDNARLRAAEARMHEIQEDRRRQLAEARARREQRDAEIAADGARMLEHAVALQQEAQEQLRAKQVAAANAKAQFLKDNEELLAARARAKADAAAVLDLIEAQAKVAAEKHARIAAVQKRQRDEAEKKARVIMDQMQQAYISYMSRESKRVEEEVAERLVREEALREAKIRAQKEMQASLLEHTRLQIAKAQEDERERIEQERLAREEFDKLYKKMLESEAEEARLRRQKNMEFKNEYIRLAQEKKEARIANRQREKEDALRPMVGPGAPAEKEDGIEAEIKFNEEVQKLKAEIREKTRIAHQKHF